jgi:hypothetical protein
VSERKRATIRLLTAASRGRVVAGQLHRQHPEAQRVVGEQLFRPQVVDGLDAGGVVGRHQLPQDRLVPRLGALVQDQPPVEHDARPRGRVLREVDLGLLDRPLGVDEPQVTQQEAVAADRRAQPGPGVVHRHDHLARTGPLRDPLREDVAHQRGVDGAVQHRGDPHRVLVAEVPARGQQPDPRVVDRDRPLQPLGELVDDALQIVIGHPAMIPAGALV